LMSIWKEGWVNDQLKSGDFGFVRMMDSNPGEVVRKARSHPLVSLLEDAEGERGIIQDGPYKR